MHLALRVSCLHRFLNMCFHECVYLCFCVYIYICMCIHKYIGSDNISTWNVKFWWLVKKYTHVPRLIKRSETIQGKGDSRWWWQEGDHYPSSFHDSWTWHLSYIYAHKLQELEVICIGNTRLSHLHLIPNLWSCFSDPSVLSLFSDFDACFLLFGCKTLIPQQWLVDCWEQTSLSEFLWLAEVGPAANLPLCSSFLHLWQGCWGYIQGTAVGKQFWQVIVI